MKAADSDAQRSRQMSRRWIRIALWGSVHVGAIALLWIAFSFALFLGLQVSTLYGNLGLLGVASLAGAYVYFGWIRNRKRPPPRGGREP